ncbi:IclR family transcriptional regulator C-terminal domain-containing protein [Microbacterium sp. Marseille-Q6965]|uniref:IclR family transcriptional regulator domain-containing protein n=1 Tax=Microbacterium sp. Marseille-Q6965 TaxID=2965072 RepID=UPI0021B71434|nr:IclR family transcriptional regulator C-terminal domain-containing protein [Microbacterium sp. Marseille-Q6965]
MSQPDPREFVQSFARGLAVIRAFDAEHPTLTLSEVAARADVTRAAARRFLHTLETLGYVRVSGRDFALTPRVLELGFRYLSALSLPEVAQPHLERLSREVDESVSAAVLDGADIVYVARVPTRRIMSVGITIGTRFPAHATSMGRVLLAALAPHERAAVLVDPLASPATGEPVDPGALAAALDEAAADGYAIVDGELEAGVRSVAAPVRGRGGRVVAAVNVSTSTTRVPTERLRAQILPALLDAVRAIEAELRHL